jgi:hypothetical protein
MPSDFASHKESVIRALDHRDSGPLPRGELFLARDFLDNGFPGLRGDYMAQLDQAVRVLGLSAVGIDLSEEQPNLEPGGRCPQLEACFTIGCINGPFSRLTTQLGFVNAMKRLGRNRESLSDLFQEMEEDAARKSGYARDNGMSAITLADDIAGNRGLLFSHDIFARMFLPCYERVAEMIKARGLYAFFHADGDTRKVIDPLARAGYDCIHPVDGQAGMDLYELTRDVGKHISFMGHVDTAAWDGVRVAAEVERAEAGFKGGGLILGSSGGISWTTITPGLVALYPGLKDLPVPVQALRGEDEERE